MMITSASRGLRISSGLRAMKTTSMATPASLPSKLWNCQPMPATAPITSKASDQRGGSWPP
jgi:hypothetical protein